AMREPARRSARRWRSAMSPRWTWRPCPPSSDHSGGSVPIDPSVAIGAELRTRELSWNNTDVLLYHLALGAQPDELHYVYERELRVLPTFAVVAPTLRDTEPPTMVMPGVDVDL